MKKPEEKKLRLLEREVEPELAPTPTPTSPPTMDAAESRWDAWSIALARLEAEETGPRLN